MCLVSYPANVTQSVRVSPKSEAYVHLDARPYPVEFSITLRMEDEDTGVQLCNKQALVMVSLSVEYQKELLELLEAMKDYIKGA